jgi:hypothetical protein
MIYIGIVTPVLIALAGMYAAWQDDKTPPWLKKLLPLFALLTLISGGYSVYSTYCSQEILEPWEAMQVIYARTVDAWSLVSEANQTKDSAKLDKVMDDFKLISQDAMKSRAPVWFKNRIMALGIAVELWAMAEKYPSLKPEENMDILTQEKCANTPFEGHPDKLLAMLGFFRIQDFGPPHRVLLGYGFDGNLQMDPSQFSKSFLLDRAHDFFTDLTGMSQ